jgi:hypothetical protein
MKTILIGLLTPATRNLVRNRMLVAMASTKIPSYVETYPLPLPPVPPHVGFWVMLHEIRSVCAIIKNEGM